MYEFSFTIIFNEDGLFKGVESNGVYYSLEEWNKQFKECNPQQDEICGPPAPSKN